MAPYMSYNTSEKLQSKWRYYEINEMQHRDIFRTSDRIKIVYSMLTTTMNIFKLSNPTYQVLESFGALHDSYELNKIPKLHLFKEMPKIQEACAVPDFLDKMLKFMSSLSDEAEDRDFIDASIKQKTSYPLFTPSKMDIAPIQNYFGEKIALYFTFLQNFAAGLKSFGFFGVFLFIVDMFLLYKGNQEAVSG